MDLTDFELDSMDYWRLCDEVSVIQAILLLLGHDPAGKYKWADGDSNKRPIGYDAVSAALKNAIMSKTLPAIEVPIAYDAHNEFFNPGPSDLINWHETRVNIIDLKTWLSNRGVKSGFFFPDSKNIPDYLDPNNPYYAPKLAAAVKAWQAVTIDEDKLKGKTPKQAMDKWLRENGSHYGLTKDEDGSPNEQGIEDVSKIANWNTKGGAPKTPG